MECVDEAGFVLGGVIDSESLGSASGHSTAMSLFNLSNGCAVNLSWQHKRHSLINRVVSENVPSKEEWFKINPFKKG
jgi:hypothetical protein